LGNTVLDFSILNHDFGEICFKEQLVESIN
jgi:hypothetical protein